MSDKNMGIIIALAAGVYLLSKRQPVAYAGTAKGGVAVMPGSAGAGWQQTAANALTGFLQGAASGVLNGANAYTPSYNNSYTSSTDLLQSGTVQDVAADEDIWGALA